MKRSMRHTATARPGYVIFAVLIVVVVLALVAYRFTDAMTAEYRVGARANDAAQAKAAAMSGLHYTAAVLADRDTLTNELGGNPFDNPDIFQQFTVQGGGGATTRKTAYFDIRSVVSDGAGGSLQRFGVIDEGGKLNINSLIALDPTGEVLYSALMLIPNMTPEAADAIVDWVDADDTPRPAGAESAAYSAMPNPYKAKNGPLNSLDELLLVQGVTPDLLYGGDRNRNGTYDDGDTGTDRGWADYLTVYGRELNVASDGQVRTYLNGDDLTTMQQQLGPQLGDELTAYIMAAKLFTVTQTSTSGSMGGTATATVTGISSSGTTAQVTLSNGSNTGNNQSQRATRAATLDEIQAAVSTKMANTYTGGNRIKSVMDLINSSITLPRASDASDDDPDLIAYSPLQDANKLASLLPTLMDRTTTKQAVELVPRINVNTAPREVLMAIPGMTDAYADAMLTAREGVAMTDPSAASAAWMITLAGISPSVFKTFEQYVTGTSMIYRVQSIGYFMEGGPVARMEAVIDTNQGAPRFLFVRDLTDLENPRGFDPAKPTGP